MEKDQNFTSENTLNAPSTELPLEFFECENFNNFVVLEGMTSISALIRGIRAGVNRRKIEKILVDGQRIRAKAKELGFLRAVSAEIGFKIEQVDQKMIDDMTSGTTHGGIVALCTDRPLPRLEDVIKTDPVWQKKDAFFVMLEGIEDPYNFGYALRSLYAAGADGIILPPRNWMSAASVVARASAGASELFPMCICEPSAVAAAMKSLGIRIVCAGIRDSVPMNDANMKRPLLLVIGGEKRGISRAVLDTADEIVRVEYGRDFRGSLSASAATTVLAFEVLRQSKG